MRRLRHRLQKEQPYARRPRPRANPSKRKGTAWESEVVRYLSERGFPEARRNVQYGAKDIGDVGGVPYFALEAKNVQSITLADFVKQANREAGNAGEPFGAVVVKKRNASTGDAYFVMDFETAATVIWCAGAWLTLTERLDQHEPE